MATAEIEEGSFGIEIRQPNGQFQPIKAPSGFTPAMFRNCVAAYDTAYRVLGMLPTIDDVFKQWPKIPKKTYSAILQTPEFAEALRYRGIEVDPDAGLSYEQRMAILALSDPFDKRALSVRLKELHIPMVKYLAWTKQAHFKEAQDRISKSAYEDALPALRNRLIANAESGDQRSLEMVFAITGEWDPNAREVQNAAAVVQAVVEAVIKYADTDAKKAILADVRLVAGAMMAATGRQSSLEG